MEHPIAADTGAEILAGSTRMKAGTAQKAILNLLSTAIMLRKGLVYRGRMVNMRVSNVKLLARGQRMVADLAETDLDTAESALARADHDIKLGVLVALGVGLDEAKTVLTANDMNLRAALDAVRKGE